MGVKRISRFHSEAGASEAPKVTIKKVYSVARTTDPVMQQAEVIANSLAVQKDWSIGSTAWGFARDGAYAAPPAEAEDVVLERVARALCQANNLASLFDWDALPEATKEHAYTLAHAALRAARGQP